MSCRLATLLALASALLLTPAALAQITINLNTVIGPTGTNAAAVAGVGNPVNKTGVGNDGIATTLTASGSPNPTSFNFNSGFGDSLDRAIGSTASAGSVIADMKHDSGLSGAFILDANNDGSFSESVLPGFGLHGDTYITFDLDVIRANASLAPGTAFTLTGLAGQANYTPYGQTSAAIILDSSELAVFDWTQSGPTYQSTSFSLSIAGSAHYLTFVALSGLDLDNWGAHVGFANPQLQAVPEPSTLSVIVGVMVLTASILRRRLLAPNRAPSH